MDVKRIYEAMFLFDTVTGNNSEKVTEIINRLMERSNSELISQVKWDERRLAYEIQGHKRGVYVLAFFRTSPESIEQIERDIRLSDDVLRVLILKRDKITEEQIQEISEQAKSAYTPEEDSSVEAELPDEEELTPIALEVTETSETSESAGELVAESSQAEQASSADESEEQKTE